MASITLNKPASGQRQTVQVVRGAGYTLDFPADQAEISRDEENLVFSFTDGSKLEVENFYMEYVKDNLPEFQVEGRLIAGLEFFEAFASDIAPAAGIGTSQRGGRYSEYGNSELLNGLGHLNDLDWGMRTAESEDPEFVESASPLLARLAPLLDQAEPGLPPPLPPVIPPPVIPPPVGGVSIGRHEALTVDEKFLTGGAHQGSAADGTDHWADPKSLIFDAPDGVGTVTIGATVLTDGVPAFISGAHGTLQVTLHLDADGKGGSLEYTYLLTQNLQHPDGDGRNITGGDSFSVLITDSLGGQGSTSIDTNVIDDIPSLTLLSSNPYGNNIVYLEIHLTEGADGLDWSTFSINGQDVNINNLYAGLDLGNGISLAGDFTFLPDGTLRGYLSVSNGVHDLDISVMDNDGDLAELHLTCNYPGVGFYEVPALHGAMLGVEQGVEPLAAELAFTLDEHAQASPQSQVWDRPEQQPEQQGNTLAGLEQHFEDEQQTILFIRPDSQFSHDPAEPHDGLVPDRAIFSASSGGQAGSAHFYGDGDSLLALHLDGRPNEAAGGHGGVSGIDVLLVDMDNLENWSGALDGLLSSARDTEVVIGGHRAYQVHDLASIGIHVDDKIYMGENDWKYTETVGGHAHFEGAGGNIGLVATVDANSLGEDTKAAMAQIHQEG